MVATTARTLYLKAARYRSTRSNFQPMALESVILSAWNSTSSTQPLVWPELDAAGNHQQGNEGKRHWFINLVVEKSRGVSVRLCSYTPSEIPTSMPLDFSVKNVGLENTPIMDRNGDERQLVHVVHAHIYNQVVVIESTRGAGNLDEVARYITEIARLFTSDNKYPRIHLNDVISKDLKSAIKAGGGAKAVELALSQPKTSSRSVYASSLISAKKAIGGTDSLVLKWENKSGSSLKIKDVEKAFDEAETYDEIDRISISLRNGETLYLGKHRIKKTVVIPQVAGVGAPSADQVYNLLYDYLLDLIKNHVLTGDGQLKSATATP
ncbi:MAG: hypothetical protein JJT90_10640 [Ectothiorhodospiraceae bacterium]|nr:hypothetical protein [Ectothiorhodospiraceae bacterium]